MMGFYGAVKGLVTLSCIAAIALAVGCDSQNRVLPDTSQTPAISLNLPALPSDAWVDPVAIASRRPSVMASIELPGDACFDKGVGATTDEGAHTVTLRSVSGTHAWAMYCFSDLLDSDKPLGFTVDLVGALPTICYVAYSNYSSGVWEWKFITLPSTAETVAMPDSDNPISESGNCYIIVASHGYATAVVGSVTLQLNMDAPPPQALAATDGTSASTIGLSWIDPADSYAGLVYDAITIERLTEAGGEWAEIAQVPSGVTTYDDVHTGSDAGENNISYDTPVLYRIRTLANGHTGPASLSDSGYRKLARVTDLSATDGTLHDRVRISWSVVSGADTYDLYYKQTRYGDAYWVVLAQLPGTQDSYDHLWDAPDKPCWYNNSYDYRIKARYLDDVCPEWSNVDAGFRVLPDVTGVTASDGEYDDRIVISWDAVSVADGYDLEATRTWHDDGVYTQIAHLDGPGATSFDHTAAEPVGHECNENTSYTYRVKATFNADKSVNYGSTDRGHYGPGAWPMYRRSLKHDAKSPFIGPHTGSQQGWSLPSPGGGRFASPVIGGDETIYIGTYSVSPGALNAINPDGTPKWNYPVDSEIQASAAVSVDGIVYVGTTDGTFYAFDHEGAELWTFAAAGSITTGPAIGHNGRIYFAGGNNLYSLNDDGSLDWWYPTAGAVESSPAVDENGVVYFGSGDSFVYAVNVDGSLKWSYETGGAVQSSPAIGPDGTVYIGSNDSYLYALTDSGSSSPTVAWKSSCNSSPVGYSSPALGETYIYIGGGYFTWFDYSGTGIWGDSNGLNCPIIDESNVVYAGKEYSGFQAYDANHLMMFHQGYIIGNRIELPIAVDGSLLVADGSSIWILIRE